MNAIEVFCPGSVANISCGFDILGLCLDSIGDTMRVKKVSKKGITIKSISGYNLSLKTNENAAGVSALALINQYKNIDYGFEIEIIKKIKPGSGIGSSAASATGSVFAINELLGKPFSKKELVKFALEGEYICSKSYHADNISPLIFGGITLVRDHKELDIVNLPTPSELYITIIHPQIEIKTSDSRSIIDRNIHISKMIGQSANLGAFIEENQKLWGPAFEKDMGGRKNWGVGQKLNNIEQQYSTVMTWDSFESVADAIKFMNGEFSQPQVRNSKMADIMPDGFTSRIIVRDVMWAVD